MCRLVGPLECEFEDTNEKQQVNTSRQSGAPRSLGAEELTNDRKGTGLATSLKHTRKGHGLGQAINPEEFQRREEGQPAHNAHTVPAQGSATGTESVFPLGCVLHTKQGVGRACPCGHMSTFNKISVKGMLKGGQQSLTRETWISEI